MSMAVMGSKLDPVIISVRVDVNMLSRDNPTGDPLKIRLHEMGMLGLPRGPCTWPTGTWIAG